MVTTEPKHKFQITQGNQYASIYLFIYLMCYQKKIGALFLENVEGYVENWTILTLILYLLDQFLHQKSPTF